MISGLGAISGAGEDRLGGSGAVVFVGAKVEHHFHAITEDITIFVVLAPAQGVLAQE